MSGDHPGDVPIDVPGMALLISCAAVIVRLAHGVLRHNVLVVRHSSAGAGAIGVVILLLPRCAVVKVS